MRWTSVEQPHESDDPLFYFNLFSGSPLLPPFPECVHQIFIWDMSSLSATSTHYTPGSGCSKPGDVTSLAWNSQKEHILASSLSSGFCIIWDLRSKKEIRTFQYGGAASTGGPMGAVGAGAGGRVAMSSVCWHPENVSLISHCAGDSLAGR